MPRRHPSQPRHVSTSSTQRVTEGREGGVNSYLSLALLSKCYVQHEVDSAINKTVQLAILVCFRSHLFAAKQPWLLWRRYHLRLGNAFTNYLQAVN